MCESDLKRVLVVVVAAVAIVASAGGAAAGGPAQQNAARPEATINQLPEAWPTETIGAGGWTVYTQMGVAVQDKSAADGDCSTGGSNPSGATDIIRGDSPYHPSALWAYDPATNVFYYRIRVAGMPLTNGAQNNGTRTGGDPWTNVTWNLLIDADNDGWKEFTVVLDGDSGGKQGSDISVPPATNDGDDVKIYYNNGAGQCVTAEAVSGNQITNPYQLVWWGNAGTQNAAVPGSPTGDGATWDFGRTRCVYHTASSTTWGRGYFVDFQFPLSALTDAYNLGSGGTPLVGLDTPLAFGYGTSNSNQNPLQKDYATNFCYTAGCDVRFPYSDVVTLGGGTAHDPIIGAMSLSEVTCPSRVTVHAAVASALKVEPPDTGTGVVEDTIAWVRFEYFLDADADGMADDAGSSWTPMAGGGRDGAEPRRERGRRPDGRLGRLQRLGQWSGTRPSWPRASTSSAWSPRTTQELSGHQGGRLLRPGRRHVRTPGRTCRGPPTRTPSTRRPAIVSAATSGWSTWPGSSRASRPMWWPSTEPMGLSWRGRRPPAGPSAIWPRPSRSIARIPSASITPWSIPPGPCPRRATAPRCPPWRMTASGCIRASCGTRM